MLMHRDDPLFAGIAGPLREFIGVPKVRGRQPEPRATSCPELLQPGAVAGAAMVDYAGDIRPRIPSLQPAAR